MRILSLTVSFLLAFGCAALAQDPSALKEQANGHAMAAGKLMQQGISLAQAPSVEARKTAVQLLIQAGQLFEQAAAIYQSLVPQYAAQSDADNARRAMENCINVIAQLKQGL